MPKWKRLLWPLAVVSVSCGLAGSVFAGEPVAVDLSVVQLTWPQVALIVGLAAAWGDMRANVREIKKELDEVRMEVRRRAG